MDKSTLSNKERKAGQQKRWGRGILWIYVPSEKGSRSILGLCPAAAAREHQHVHLLVVTFLDTDLLYSHMGSAADLILESWQVHTYSSNGKCLQKFMLAAHVWKGLKGYSIIYICMCMCVCVCVSVHAQYVGVGMSAHHKYVHM